MTITRAERRGGPTLISLWGGSFMGKTMSALLIARGLVGPEGKIGMIDTENRRGVEHAEVAGGWDHMDFQPPFSPLRYIDAMKEYETAGNYDCLIIDSTSHCWEGEGGVLDQAEKNANKGPLTWKAPKMAYKKMINHMLRSPCHVIFCLRSKTEYDWNARDENGKKQPKILGLVPICGENFIYEMTISIQLGLDHKPVFDAPNAHPGIASVKAPPALFDTIKPGEFLDVANGEAIAAWLSEGVKIDKELETLKREARDVAYLGTERMSEFWKALGGPKQHKLQPIQSELRSIAEEADIQPDEQEYEEGDPFTKKPSEETQSDDDGVIT